MVIERTDKEVIIRLPANINVDGLQRLVDYLTYKEVTSKSEATQEDVDDLAKEVKASWWVKNKERLTK
ncbi:MAG TPA: hypothetical protein VFM79_08925 [Pelobium sp.]|nr:hypothetical protein [Pelobium sp.]